MADFAQFESDPEIKPTEEDPAAEFLAREQNELAELEDDNFGIAPGTQQMPGIDLYRNNTRPPVTTHGFKIDAPFKSNSAAYIVSSACSLGLFGSTHSI